MAGGDYDTWDLQIRSGLLGKARLRMVIEEHGAGKQMLKFSIGSHYSIWGSLLTLLFAVFGFAAGADSDWIISTILLTIAIAIVARSHYESMTSITAFLGALKALEREIKNGRK